MLPLFAVTFGDFVNALTDADVMPRAQKAASNLAILAAAVLVAFYLQAFLWMWTGAKSSNRLRTKYLAAVLKQDIQYFDTQATTGEGVRILQQQLAPGAARRVFGGSVTSCVLLPTQPEASAYTTDASHSSVHAAPAAAAPA
jgi:ABC-type multidrug transport system fused ATPase/permease subunit